MLRIAVPITVSLAIAPFAIAQTPTSEHVGRGNALQTQSDQHPILAILSDPEEADGMVFAFTFYPYDLLGDPNRYIMCLDPCTKDHAIDVQTVIFPDPPGSFDGYRGTRAVSVTVKFDAECFIDGFCLAHRPLIFRALEQAKLAAK